MAEVWNISPEDALQRVLAMIAESGKGAVLHSGNIPGNTEADHYLWMAAWDPEEEVCQRHQPDFLHTIASWHRQGKPVFVGMQYSALHLFSRVSAHPLDEGNPDCFAFVPRCRVWVNRTEPDVVHFSGNVPVSGQKEYIRKPIHGGTVSVNETRKHYLDQISRIREDITEGDFYELNYCIRFDIQTALFDSVSAFLYLIEKASAPFSALVLWDDFHLVCGSPERYIAGNSTKVLSQPIKGTRRRSADPAADEDLRTELEHSEKDRSENVMIVDLVRNDLSRCCAPGSVKVQELMKVYTFPRVHQMISTVTGEFSPGMDLTDALAATFPMGSMTGAPKVMVMNRIHAYEKQPRGWFSGTIGYWMPGGEFDLNVLIRTLIFSPQTGSLQYYAGGAITFDSHPDEEWEEVMVKAAPVFSMFGCEKPVG